LSQKYTTHIKHRHSSNNPRLRPHPMPIQPPGIKQHIPFRTMPCHSIQIHYTNQPVSTSIFPIDFNSPPSRTMTIPIHNSVPVPSSNPATLQSSTPHNSSSSSPSQHNSLSRLDTGACTKRQRPSTIWSPTPATALPSEARVNAIANSTINGN